MRINFLLRGKILLGVLGLLALIIVFLGANNAGDKTPPNLHHFLSTTEIPDNIYVHAVNSPQRVLEYQQYYHNFELDVFIDSKNNALDIFHYPEESSDGFYFSDFLALLDGPLRMRFWLDVKNLNTDNWDILLSILGTLTDQFSLSKESFLIESKNNKSLAKINEAGYATSFYLPTNFTVRDSCLPEDQHLNLVKGIQDHENTYISFPLSAKSVVDLCLNPHLKELKMLSWAPSANYITKNVTRDFEKFIVDHQLEPN